MVYLSLDCPSAAPKKLQRYTSLAQVYWLSTYNSTNDLYGVGTGESDLSIILRLVPMKA